MHLRLLFVFSFILPIAACGSDHEFVFPGARGFGVHTPAGRGGKVIRVTNLNSEGPGSFRAALEQEGARIVVFEVGGVINLAKKNLLVTEPFLTVAGQTAPSPGITLIRGGMGIETHDVLIQHIRIRPGDAGEPKKSGWEPDGITTTGPSAYNIVIDHCSISWGVDENLSASGPRLEGPAATSHDVTFSHCIIAEGLSDSAHSKGPHSKGSLIHDNCTNIAVIGNLYAHNVERNPYFKACTTGVIVNNLIYNPGRHAIKVQYSDGEWRRSQTRRPENARLSIVGNVLVHGVNTEKALPLVGRAGGRGKGDLYLEDNIAKLRSGEDGDIFVEPYRILNEKPLWPERLTALPASETVEYVLRQAGARPRDRDACDRRIVRTFRERAGKIIDSQADVGGYPRMTGTTRKLKIPEKNLDEWLAALASELE
jgi:hypothetical protein